MFKVPDWGNDIPQANGEVVKLFTKKRKTAENNGHLNRDNVINKKTIHKKKNGNAIRKAKDKMNGHAKLTKDDHINNRILQRNLKNNLYEAKNTNIIGRQITPSKVTLKGDKFLNGNNANSKMKRKILKRKDKISNLESNNKSVEPNITEKINSKHNKGSCRDMNINKKPNSLKRKQAQNDKSVNDVEINNTDKRNLNNDEPDKMLVNAMKKKKNDLIKDENLEDVLVGNNYKNEEERIVEPIKNKVLQNRKEKLREILKKGSNRNVIKISSNKLRERMLQRLKAAQFRYLNEKLYTASGSESQELFKSDPAAFQTYHEGYQQQVKKWPVNPLDLIVKRIQKMPKSHLIADMGCGEAALSRRVAQTVRSFDLVASAPHVEACDMAHTPLLAASVDAVVFCLALMGTNLTQYLLEANRVLKIGGHLLIAEVESRFDNVDSFNSEVQRLGFGLKNLDSSHEVFLFLEFTKQRDAPAKRRKLPTLTLKPCLYKRR